MGAENLDSKATSVLGGKKEEKKRKKKREALDDFDLVTPENKVDAENLDVKAVDASGQKKEEKKKKNKNKKREASSDIDHVTSGNKIDAEAVDEHHVDDDDLDEPTMGEKLATLNLGGDVETKSLENVDSSPSAKPPSADSVHVLLKQALHADDRVLLLDCLYTQDEKVIANSVSLLNPSDVFKLLDSLISIIQSRGAVLACALPWLRSLLLKHASGIMSQESSLLALNSLYQLIESRVSTFQSALQLSSCLDYHFAGITDDMPEEETVTPVIYEDKDESDDEDEAEDAIETDQESEEEHLTVNGFSDDEGSDESDAMTE